MFYNCSTPQRLFLYFFFLLNISVRRPFYLHGIQCLFLVWLKSCLFTLSSLARINQIISWLYFLNSLFHPVMVEYWIHISFYFTLSLYLFSLINFSYFIFPASNFLAPFFSPFILLPLVIDFFTFSINYVSAQWGQ